MSTQCLYDILQIPISATDAEIKKAYRTAALASHPDKNPGREDDAAEHFKQVQHAYAVLSDPHERAWYDDHRHQILRSGSTFRTGDAQEKAEMADATAVDLFSCFSPGAYEGFGDGGKAYYAFYGGVFDRLWAEEVEVREGGRRVGVSFGGSQAAWTTVREFYAFWESFVSAKTFAFADKWNLAEAPNRDVRRLMEKDNRKERAKLKKEFNSTVRELVAFVKKRDPRVALRRKEEEEEKAKREEERAQREKEKIRLRKEGAAEVKWMRDLVLEEDAEALDEILRNIELDEKIDRRERRRKGRREPAFQGEDTSEELSASEKGVDHPEVEINADEVVDDTSSDQEDPEEHVSDVEELYCPACRKTFRTHAQMLDHERSKKHKAAAAKLRKQLLKEEKAFQGVQAPSGPSLDSKDDGLAGPEAASERVDNVTGASRSKSKKKKKQRSNRLAAEIQLAESPVQDSHVGSDQISENFGSRFDDPGGRLADNSQLDTETTQTSETAVNPDEAGKPKVELTKKQKRKLREQRKKEQADTTSKTSSYSCNVCNSPFPSRNKLMRHVEASGHALYVTPTSNSSRRNR
eukprot:GFKZ01013357.1.p1 GENE.GFKZ01013357.1~~GFKZ01013357.1.p1  ORF type:complete len:618 (+),score=129.11 GFKZ01013357.1:120-1856(+)